MKIRLDKIASCTLHADLPREVELTDRIDARQGAVIVVRALQEKRTYDKVELVSGRMAKIGKGDVLAGVLGRRRALRGFVGEIPKQLRVGDKLHVLNLGGLLGTVVSGHLDVGKPLLCEVLGAAARDGEPITIAQERAPPPDELPDVPLVMVAGTCMAAGKTQAAVTIVQQLHQRGMRVHGAKLTGVACRRDLLNMEDHGAKRTMSFLDLGLPSTVGVDDMAGAARSVLASLAEGDPDVIVVELGDGVIGHYGVPEVLHDAAIRARAKAWIMCANDLVGAWGAVELLRGWGIEVDILSGPATDNDVGKIYAAQELRIAAANAFAQAHELGKLVEDLVT
jgi:hypothetical protein